MLEPVNRMTHTCENITFPASLRYAVSHFVSDINFGMMCEHFTRKAQSQSEPLSLEIICQANRFQTYFEPRFGDLKECMAQVTIFQSQNFYRLDITT